MKILIAPDSYKGSLSAKEVCQIIADSLSELPETDSICLPFSDGGEGFGSCYLEACRGNIVFHPFYDIYRNTISAPVYFCGDTAVIECAATCYLQDKKDIMHASSYGVGQQILFAYQQGIRKLIIGLGGSGMCDGGCGALAALGVRFYDKKARLIPCPAGKDLIQISHIDIPSATAEIIQACRVTYACDVTNTYYGSNGAAYVYAPQKGASPQEVKILDAGLEHLCWLFPTDISDLPGGGAAGGLCGGLYALFGGKIESGFQLLADVSNLEEKIEAADLVVTGEGKTDRQTCMGKLPYRIAELAAKHGKRCVLISGDSDGTVIGDKVITLTDAHTSAQTAIKQCRELLFKKAKNILQ